MIAIASAFVSLGQALAANLVADGARVAYRPGDRCEICGHAVLPGRQRVADLTGGRGVVHVAGCSTYAAVEPPASASSAAGHRGSSRGRTAP